MQELVLLGGGGHCKSCIEVIEGTGAFQILGILDRSAAVGSKVLDYAVLGDDQEIPALLTRKVAFLVTVGQIKSATARLRLFHELCRAGAQLPKVIALSAVVSRYATVGAGTIVMNHCLVNSSSRIGANCIINSCANIEHDTVIGDHCHISTGAMVNGDVKIGQQVFVGSGAVIAHGVSICDGAVIGAGSVVINNIKQPGVYAGNPASVLSPR